MYRPRVTTLAVGMSEPADDTKVASSLFQDLERGRQLVPLSRLFWLPLLNIHSVRNIAKYRTRHWFNLRT